MSQASKNRAAALVATFKQNAQAARKEIELPVPLASNPDFVFRCVVRRVDINSLIMDPSFGLPEHFINDVLGTISPDKLRKLKESAEEAQEIAEEAIEKTGYTVDDLRAIRKFARRVAQEVCLEPQIVFSVQDEWPADKEVTDEMIDLDDPAFAHCAPEIITALNLYGRALSPGVPVKLKNGGEASLEGVTNFPEESALPNPVHDGETVRDTPVEADGDSQK